MNAPVIDEAGFELAREQQRILLVDDHALVRSGIRLMLETRSGWTVVGEASDGHDAIEQIAALHPDIVVMDISMPSPDGIETATLMRQRFPDLKILMLSMHASALYVKHSMAAGALGYCVKSAPPDELIHAVQTVLNGDSFVSRQIEPPHMQEKLSARQLQVLELIALSYTSKEIARELGISVKTVDSHRTALMRQLDLHDVAGLVRYAVRAGVITSCAARRRA